MFDDKGRYDYHRGHINGFWKNGLLHGFGDISQEKGKKTYLGFFKEGKLDGRGCEITENGDQYKGECFKGMKHGQGITIYKDGTFHTGTYSQDKPFGKGEYDTGEDGAKFSGNFNGLVLSGVGQRRGKTVNGQFSLQEGHFINS